jgi:hypothetical protein
LQEVFPIDVLHPANAEPPDIELIEPAFHRLARDAETVCGYGDAGELEFLLAQGKSQETTQEVKLGGYWTDAL